MYGIVNKAIQELVLENFGEEKWIRVKEASGVDIDFFMSNEPYPDEVTYKLAVAASEQTGLPLRDILIAFGEWWVIKTGKEKYGGLMAAGGNSLREFLLNLPVFHNRVVLIYPKLSPPEFRISDVAETSLHVHYISKREGLEPFVTGLLQGLGKMYGVAAEITLLKSRAEGDSHEVFKVSW